MELRTKLIIILVLYVVGIYKLIKVRIFLREHKSEITEAADEKSIVLDLLPFDIFEVMENQRKYKLIHLFFVAFSWLLGIYGLILYTKQFVRTIFISIVAFFLSLSFLVLAILKNIWQFIKELLENIFILLKSLINI